MFKNRRTVDEYKINPIYPDNTTCDIKLTSNSDWMNNFCSSSSSTQITETHFEDTRVIYIKRFVSVALFNNTKG